MGRRVRAAAGRIASHEGFSNAFAPSAPSSSLPAGDQPLRRSHSYEGQGGRTAFGSYSPLHASEAHEPPSTPDLQQGGSPTLFHASPVRRSAHRPCFYMIVLARGRRGAGSCASPYPRVFFPFSSCCGVTWALRGPWPPPLLPSRPPLSPWPLISCPCWRPGRVWLWGVRVQCGCGEPRVRLPSPSSSPLRTPTPSSPQRTVCPRHPLCQSPCPRAREGRGDLPSPSGI